MFIRVKVQGQTSAKCNYFQWNRKTYFIKLHQFLISSFSVTGLTHEHTQTQRVRSKTIPCFRRFSSAQSKYSVQCIRIKEDQSYRQVRQLTPTWSAFNVLVAKVFHTVGT